jgi:hypothetical protein
VLLDVAARAPGRAVYSQTSPPVQLYPPEAEWLAAAAAYGDDTLWVAPAGDGGAAASYPAALAVKGDRLLSVGAVGCDGRVWPGGAGRVDLLAPGVDVVGAVPDGGASATLAIASAAPLVGAGPSAGAALAGKLALAVAVPGSAVQGGAEVEVALHACRPGGACPRGGRQLCVAPASPADATAVVCSVLGAGGCTGGLLLVPAAPRGAGASAAPLPSGAEVRAAVVACREMAARYEARSPNAAPQQGAPPPPPVMLAGGANGSALLAALLARGGTARARLRVVAGQQKARTGTSQAAAWVAGGAARLMAAFPMCGASDVAGALLSTAALLDAAGAPTGRRGRGGLLQLADAEGWLARRPCAGARPPRLPLADSLMGGLEAGPARAALPW